MRKRIVLLFFIFVPMIYAFAQERRDAGKDVDELFGNNKSKYWDNWFISASASGNLLFGEEDRLFQDQGYGKWSDRAMLGGAVSLGKWFNPYFGARVQVIRGTLCGYNRTLWYAGGGQYTFPNGRQWQNYPQGFDLAQYDNDDNPPIGGYVGNVYQHKKYWSKFPQDQLFYFKNDPDYVDGFLQKFKYMSITADFMFNMTNLFRGHYRPGWLEVAGFIGGGPIQAYDNKLTTIDYIGVAVKVGGNVNLNITSNLALVLEAQASLTFNEFDGYLGTTPGDAVLNGLVGLQYTINRNFTPESVGFLSPDEINYLNEKINANRSLLEKHQNILDRQQSLLDKLNDCCEEGRVIVEGGTSTTRIISQKYVPEYVRFTLNSSQIQFTEENKLRDAAEFLKANPNSKLLLVGYADKNTGSSSYNYELSRKRVQSVSEELMRRGIDSKRLILEWKGDKEQPYAPNDWNRVVIMVER